MKGGAMTVQDDRGPVPASSFPYQHTLLHWWRNPGGRRNALSKSPRRCGKSVVPSSTAEQSLPPWMLEAVGLSDLLGDGPPGLWRGGCCPRRSRRVSAVWLPSAIMGRSREQGRSMPVPRSWRSRRRLPDGGGVRGPSTEGYPAPPPPPGEPDQDWPVRSKQGEAESRVDGAISSLTEDLGKDERSSDDSATRERTRPGLYVVVLF
ncbi:hypothetical protein PO909_021386 [Leuciscus waleckii]